MRKFLFFLSVILSLQSWAQQDSLVLGFKEYLGYVKKHHPIAKQAQLTLSIGQAQLLKARGGFDPKVEVDYTRKEFKDTQYWERLNATFKIPTYFGIEFKGGYEQYEGTYINPSETVPDNGLYSAGVSMSILDGFWANERMATLRKAKFFRERSKAEQDLLVNQVLYNAAVAYFDWVQAYGEAQVYVDFLENAEIRFRGVKQAALVGDKAMIDTVEAKIVVENRQLSLEQAQVSLMKKRLELSNFLWINDIPVELKEGIAPDNELALELDETLEINGLPLDSFTIDNHPKLRSLEFKIKELLVDKRLKTNKLLPKLDVEYNFLTTEPDQINSFVPENYKGGVSFNFPLFLRKERGDLRLAKFKLRDAEFERDNAQVEIRNKVLAIYGELDSFDRQNVYIDQIVRDYNTLLAGEERKFGVGESSLFILNSRENKLIDAELKRLSVRNKFYKAKANLFKSLAINPENL
ncbi:TolC family protein [Croceivirga radicis]|uniref:TolC family protein n=1 Tax=Croceivirga radicis TaxID=1929488 RepID=UPI000255AE7E|nr:TolC family protein [Croceivirga radicis]